MFSKYISIPPQQKVFISSLAKNQVDNILNNTLSVSIHPFIQNSILLGWAMF